MLTLVALAALLPETPSHAEGDASVMNWRPAAPQSRTAPARPARQTYRARRRYDTPRAVKTDDATLGLTLPEVSLKAPTQPETSKMRLAVIGDSLAEALGAGIEADPALQAEFSVLRKTVSASGLVRDDFHNWETGVATLLRENPDVAAIIIMVGLNDRQTLRLGTQALEPLSEAWKTAYRQRVDAVIAASAKARVPLVWVGLPVVRSARLSADLVQINALIRERVVASGETYIETFENFADESGGFASSGPDIIGDTVRLRGPDGIHFTPAGQRKLAFFVDKPLHKRLGDRLPKATSAPALAVLPTPALPGALRPDIVVPTPGPAPLALPKVRPEIGETRPLGQTQPANLLVGRPNQPPEDPATRDLFDRGLAPEARAGRADDFRWK